MKVHLNLVDFYDTILPKEEINDSTYNSSKLILFGKSGIHIKEKNKGSFTSYCGGKVTDACIRKAKNSPSVAIRKKATFADNARHWSKKHQFGGKIDLSKLFIDVDEPTEFASREIWEDMNDATTTPTLKKEEVVQSSPIYELPDFLSSPRTITALADASGDVPTTPEKQARHGMKFFQLGGSIPFIDTIDPFEDSDTPTYFARNFPVDSEIDFLFEENGKPKVKEETITNNIGYTLPSFLSSPRITSNSLKSTPTYSGKGYNDFKSKWDEYIKNNPDASKYEGVLTAIAKHESNFNPTILNTAGAPAYGYFQFWEDGKTNNISHYSGLSVEDFRNNPLALIEAAVKMARSIENQFNSEDLRLAKAKGYNMRQLIRGAWLGGVGGVRKVLRGLGNPSDSKWYKNGKGRSVKDAMDELT